MKKHLLTLTILLYTAVSFAQQTKDTTSAAYKRGYQLGQTMIWVVLTVILIFALYTILKSRKKD